MIEGIEHAIAEWEADNREPATIFLHPRTEYGLQREVADEQEVPVELNTRFEPYEVRSDHFMAEDEVKILPSDTDDFQSDELFQSDPTRHHLKQALGDIEQHPHDTPDQSILTSNVIIELRSVVMEINEDKVDKMNLTVPELEASPEGTEIIDVDDDDNVQTLREIKFNWEPGAKAQKIPVTLVGLGEVEYDEVRNTMMEQVLDTLHSKIESPITGQRVESVEGSNVQVEPHSDEPTEAEFDTEVKEYKVGTKVTRFGRLFMQNDDETQVITNGHRQ